MSPFQVPAHRNLAGYGPQPPHAQWPGGARVAVSLVMNVEEGSEQAVSRGDAVNEHVYDMIDVVTGGPNLTMESHFDYGTARGLLANRPRARALRRHVHPQRVLGGARAVAVARPRRGRRADSRSRATGIDGSARRE